MSEIRSWLESLGLGQYGDAFERNAIAAGHLSELDHELLSALGVTAMGHRITILKAIESGAQPTAPPGSASALPEPAPERSSGEAERRQLTVMFCDLVGSTSLSRAMDPEEYRDILAAYQDTARSSIEANGGYIARYMGDGLLVYFGYPQAHEDDAIRAVRSGLEVTARVRALDVHDGLDLDVRVGIATGLVVVGDIVGEGASEERAVLGETPNLAARLQGIAKPGEVVVAPATGRLVEQHFAVARMPPVRLKGFAEVVEPVKALGQSDIRQPSPVSLGIRAPMVGRGDELGMLERRFELAASGEGQVVYLRGEPGIGKTRLVQALQATLVEIAPLKLHYQGSPYHLNSAFHPIVEQLERAARLGRDEDGRARLDKLRRLLAGNVAELDLATDLLGTLLSLPVDGRCAASITPERRKSQTIVTLKALLARFAEQRPVLFVVEDAHWMDPSTIETLGAFIETIRVARVLMIVTFRPDFSPPWPDQGHVTHLSLNRLGRRDGTSVLEQVVGDASLPTNVVDTILSRTDGVPLFVEELTKHVLELRSRGSGVGESTIPTTLHDSLTARLDRLGDAKAVAQLAAVIGRRAAYPLLEQVCDLDEDVLRAHLARLVDVGLLHQDGSPPDAVFTFSHGLTRDAAYESLLRSRCARHHLRIAESLVDDTKTAETQPELVAHHFEQAHESARALEYWQRAGQRANEHCAHAEAVSHLTRGLEVLGSQAESEVRVQTELSLRVSLGPALMATSGQHSEQVEHNYRRARALCVQVGDDTQQFPALAGLHRYYFVQGDYRSARQLGEQFLMLAQSVHGDPSVSAAGHWLVGTPLLWQGHVRDALGHFDQSVELYGAASSRPDIFRYGVDPVSASHGYRVIALSALGYLGQALGETDEVVASAIKVNHPFSLAYAHLIVAMAAGLRRDWDTCQRHAHEGLGLSETHGFHVYAPICRLFHGLALGRGDRIDEGIAEMEDGLQRYRALSISLCMSYFLTSAADLYAHRGRTDEAIELLEESRDIAEKTGEHFGYAETKRLLAVLQWTEGRIDGDVAEHSLKQAIQAARQREQKTLELRATNGLARVLSANHKFTAAQDLLRPLHRWFDNNLETPDLNESRSILATLS